MPGLTRMRSTSRIARRPLQQRRMLRRPQRVLHQMRLLVDHQGGAHVFALRPGHRAVGHRRQPDVGVEADLVRGMARRHRAAARLRDIADQKAGPAVGDGVARQFLDQRDHRRMAPAAVARGPHHLPGRAIHGNGDAAGKAALGIEADRLRGGRRRQFLGAEQVFCPFLGRRRLRRRGRSGQADQERPPTVTISARNMRSHRMSPTSKPDHRTPAQLPESGSESYARQTASHASDRSSPSSGCAPRRRASRRLPTYGRRRRGSPESESDSPPP